MNKGRIAEKSSIQVRQARLKRPWWLSGSSLKNSFVQLAALALLFASLLLRDRPSGPIDYLVAALCVIWFAMAVVPSWRSSGTRSGTISRLMPAR